MALSARLEFRQGQQLVMTPQLQQAIRLLQLSNIELNAFVEAEMERNPLLERDEDGNGRAGSQPAGEAIETSDTDRATTGGDTADLDFNKTTVDYTGSYDTEIDNVYPETNPSEFGPDSQASWSTLPRFDGSSGADAPDHEAYVGNALSLKDHLTERLNLVSLLQELADLRRGKRNRWGKGSSKSTTDKKS